MLNVLLFGGRLQDEGYDNGQTELEEVLIEAVDKAGYSPMQVRIRFYPWFADVDDAARRLHLQRLRYKLPRSQFGIVVCAFSRGVGSGVMRLAGQRPWYKRLKGVGGLKRFGLKINYLVESDGIYHQWFLLHRSVVGNFPIRFPNNEVIEIIDGFRQQNSRPMGHVPIVQPPTVIRSMEVLDYEHEEMDDAPEYHQKSVEVVLEAARRFVPREHKQDTPAATTEEVASPVELLEVKLEKVEIDTASKLESKLAEIKKANDERETSNEK